MRLRATTVHGTLTVVPWGPYLVGSGSRSFGDIRDASVLARGSKCGAFPTGCAVCGSILPQWELVAGYEETVE